MDDPNSVIPGDPTAEVYSPKSYSVGGKIMLIAIVVLFGVVVLLLCIHIYARWFLYRRAQRRRRQRRVLTFTAEHQNAHGPQISNCGLDPVLLASIPVFSFSESDSDSGECAVCLSEFEENEKGRTLPGCRHSFHVECIDMWFCSHSTCPLCRSSVESAARESICVEMDGVARSGEVGEESKSPARGILFLKSIWGLCFRRGDGDVETEEEQQRASPRGGWA